VRDVPLSLQVWQTSELGMRPTSRQLKSPHLAVISPLNAATGESATILQAFADVSKASVSVHVFCYCQYAPRIIIFRF
jgi:hypothetical protein